jgi:hypothetical protein
VKINKIDGLYDYINEKDRKNLCQLWKYIILKDDEKMKFYSTLLNVKGKKINFLYLIYFNAMRLSFKFILAINRGILFDFLSNDSHATPSSPAPPDIYLQY